MAEADLRAELEALRREIAAMRAEQTATDTAGDAEEEAASESGAAHLNEQLHTLGHEISALAEEAEKAIANHGLASVVGAFILGIVIGRVFHR
jgi:acid phosphatase family membrane protein YuiD